MGTSPRPKNLDAVNDGQGVDETINDVVKDINDRVSSLHFDDGEGS